MTVAELIRELQGFDPDAVVLVGGRQVRAVEDDELDTPGGRPCPAASIEPFADVGGDGGREFPSWDAGR